MPAITKIEHEKRLRTVQEWIIDDYPSCDIVTQCIAKWGVSDRQAKRYIKDATEAWVDGNQEKLNAKRSRRIESLKKLKRDMKPEFRGTPPGMRALLMIDKEIAKLEGVIPTKQMIDAEVARDAGKQVDPLSPTSNMLIIEAMLPYGQTPAVNTANS